MIKRIIGIVAVIGGIVMILFSNYIYDQIGEGNRKINRAQSQVDMGNSIMSLTPESKMVGQHVTGSIQQKIDEGKATIEEYEILAHRLRIGGFVLIAIGAVLFLLSFIHRKGKSR